MDQAVGIIAVKIVGNCTGWCLARAGTRQAPETITICIEEERAAAQGLPFINLAITVIVHTVTSLRRRTRTAAHRFARETSPCAKAGSMFVWQLAWSMIRCLVVASVTIIVYSVTNVFGRYRCCAFRHARFKTTPLPTASAKAVGDLTVGDVAMVVAPRQAIAIGGWPTDTCRAAGVTLRAIPRHLATGGAKTASPAQRRSTENIAIPFKSLARTICQARPAKRDLVRQAEMDDIRRGC